MYTYTGGGECLGLNVKTYERLLAVRHFEADVLWPNREDKIAFDLVNDPTNAYAQNITHAHYCTTGLLMSLSGKTSSAKHLQSTFTPSKLNSGWCFSNTNTTVVEAHT